VITPTLDRYVQHAERFGVDLVFETAAGLGTPDADLTVGELVQLARRLRAIDARFDGARPDKLVELSVTETRVAYLERIAPVLDALRAPVPTSASRVCEWCGRAIAGRTDRRTHSPACRKALERAGGIGPFTRPAAAASGQDDLRVGLAGSVTPMPRRDGLNPSRKRGVGDCREVSTTASSLERPT
jgi:hypothetical protein